LRKMEQLQFQPKDQLSAVSYQLSVAQGWNCVWSALFFIPGPTPGTKFLKADSGELTAHSEGEAC